MKALCVQKNKIPVPTHMHFPSNCLVYVKINWILTSEATFAATWVKFIGEKMREVRLSKQMSLEDLANESELDYSQINRMELGKVNFFMPYFYRIAKALDVDPKELLPD